MSDTRTVTGQVEAVFPATSKEGRDKTYHKRELALIVEEKDQYTQYIKFETDKPELFDGLKPGDNVELCFNLRGRKWDSPKTGETIWFNALHVWRVIPQQVADETMPERTDSDVAEDLPF